MRKRMRLTQNMDNHHDFNSDDFLSRLPDSILVSILSGLPLKDAAATSQLSRRWRYLWCQTVRLDIDNDKRLDYIAAPSKLRLIGRNKYINWVNRVIRQHRSLTIEHFRIHYDLDMDSKGAITKWIEFAISRNVQNLVLDLTETSDYRSNPARNFVFPNNILDRKSRTSSLKQQSYFNVPGVPSTEVMEIKFLKALTLKGVNIGDETMSKILMSCRALEYLSIYNSGDMVKFKISGKELKLTTLEIVLCPGLLSIDISNSNLACFTYLGPVVRIKLNELPRLEKISIGGLGTTWIDNNLFQRISSFFHLQVLELNFPRPKEDMHLVPLPEMPNVKQLIVMADAWEDESLLGFTWVVRACPNLQRFVVELSWMPTMKRRIRKRSVVKHLHQHLERVEIGGYYGRMSDLELALYFIENGIALKKMVIDPHDQGFKRTPIRETLVKRAARSSETLKVKTARFRARHWLVPKMPPGVELVQKGWILIPAEHIFRNCYKGRHSFLKEYEAEHIYEIGSGQGIRIQMALNGSIFYQMFLIKPQKQQPSPNQKAREAREVVRLQEREIMGKNERRGQEMEVRLRRSWVKRGAVREKRKGRRSIEGERDRGEGESREVEEDGKLSD